MNKEKQHLFEKECKYTCKLESIENLSQKTLL